MDILGPVRLNNEWLAERASQSRRLTAMDLADQVAEAGDEFLAVIRGGDEMLLGKMLKAVVDSYLDSLTDRALDMDPRADDAQEAARKVRFTQSLANRIDDAQRNMLARQRGKNLQRRFSDVPAVPSAFQTLEMCK